jgi:hypothetical protein
VGSAPPADAKSQAQPEPGRDSEISRHHRNHKHHQARNGGSPDGNGRADERRPQGAAVISRSSFRALVMMQCKIKPLGRKVNRRAGKPIRTSRPRGAIRFPPSDLADSHSPVIGKTMSRREPKKLSGAPDPARSRPMLKPVVRLKIWRRGPVSPQQLVCRRTI